MPDYNTCRRAFGLPAAKTFADITPDEQVAATLKALYGNVDNIGEGERAPSYTSSFVHRCCLNDFVSCRSAPQATLLSCSGCHYRFILS